MRSNALTAPQEVLLAAASLSTGDRRDFTEWDLTVAAWQRNPNKFGCRGYEQTYPDHKRVMMEIMAKSKTDNPLRRGWIERTRPNHYRITSLGSAEAQRLTDKKTTGVTQGSSADVYDALLQYANHRVFKSHRTNGDEPKTWLDIEAFLGIAKGDPTHVRDRLTKATNAVKSAIQWMDDNGTSELRRTGGSGLTFRRDEMDALLAFVESLPEQFRVQFSALLGTTRAR